MDTEETVNMIDTIYEGSTYRMSIGRRGLVIDLAPSGIRFGPQDSGDSYAYVIDPRRAREIAGALVAWATHQEKIEAEENRA